MTYLFIFILGAIIGSFLNVCIYRLPRNESIIIPGSMCIACKKSIPWYDNIPFLSYIFLKGKCRFCKSPISFRYFIVELVSASSILILFVYFGFNYRFWIYSLVTLSLTVITFIDLEHQVMPDVITISGIILGVIVSIFMPFLQDSFTWKLSLVNSLLGVLAGGGLIYLTGVLGKLAFKKESMGGGDVKLMAMLGAFLGWKMAILIFFLAPFFGAPIGLYIKFVKKQDIIPYGPFISLAAFVAMLWGNKILSLFII